MKKKTVKAWAVLNSDEEITIGIYHEHGIHRIYKTRNQALEGRFQWFEKQKVVRCTITY